MSQPRWLALAWGDLGVAETPGADHTRRVVRYYADVGHAQITNDETAWCAAFLGSCLERAGIASTRSLMARSYLGWGEPLGEFRTGAIAVLSRTADPTLGHAGFLIGETADCVILLGGNQSDAVTVEIFPRSRLLGLRWPSPVIPDGASAPIRDPGAAGRPLQPRPRPRARNGRRLDRRPLRSRRPHQLRHHARHLRPRQRRRAHRRQRGGHHSPSSNRFPPPPCAASIASATGCSHPARNCPRRSPSSTSTPPSTRASPAPRACCRRRSAPRSTARSAPRLSARPPHARSPKRSRTTPRRAAGTTAHSPSSGVSARAGSPASTARSQPPRDRSRNRFPSLAGRG